MLCYSTYEQRENTRRKIKGNYFLKLFGSQRQVFLDKGKQVDRNY